MRYPQEIGRTSPFLDKDAAGYCLLTKPDCATSIAFRLEFIPGEEDVYISAVVRVGSSDTELFGSSVSRAELLRLCQS